MHENLISNRISDNIPSQMKKVEYGYPHHNAFLQIRLKLERCKPQKAAGDSRICDIINDVELFPTAYRKI